jgi:hypothetical protein
MLVHSRQQKSTKCSKCGERAEGQSVMKHLINCHGYGLFQCVYCTYGTNTFAIISNHLANSHPSKLPVFCERTSKDADFFVDPSKISSISLKSIKQNIPQDIVLPVLSNLEDLDNSKNIGKIGININIAGPFDDPEEKKVVLTNVKVTSGPHQVKVTQSRNIPYARAKQHIVVRKEIPSKVPPPPPPKPQSGLQIQSVFSLSDGTMHQYEAT